ncbi:MAG TPA: hypothetical protein DCX54_13795 [Flavobacteriales bacterium]|nr:hypothetical protein [Flavobacteriales bacterium]
MKFPYILKIIGAGLATIILGAIGSGVWEKLLSPGIKNLSELTTSTLSFLSQTYSDSIYMRAAYIETYSQVDQGAIMLFLMASVWLFVFALSSKTDNSLLSMLHRAITDQFKGWYGILFSSFLIILLLFLMATDTTVNEIKKYSVMNMEIVRPYIGKSEYLMLRSKYLRIKNKSDFNSFLNDLYDLSEKSNVEIKKHRVTTSTAH